MICGKRNTLFNSMKRHMRELHIGSDEEYYCPACDKYFKSRMRIYDHIRKKHKDWKGINCDSFAVKSKYV